MTNANMEAHGTKKKLLVPLVALLLCAVSFVGIGYAYNSTLNVQGNQLDATSLTLDLNDGTVDGSVDIDGDKFVFTDNITYGATKDNTINYAITTGDFATFTLKLSGDAAADKLTIDGSSLVTLLNNDVTNTEKLSDFFNFQISVKVGDAAYTTPANIANSQNYTISYDGTAALTIIVKLSITAPSATGTLKTVTEVHTPFQAGEYAAYYANMVNGTFNISFDASKTA